MSKSAEMFAGLSDEIIKKIEEITSVISYGKGDYIFKKRDDAEYLYFVIEGKIGLEINVHSQLAFLIKCIFVMCDFWRNAEDGPKDKQDCGFIFSEALKPNS